MVAAAADLTSAEEISAAFSETERKPTGTRDDPLAEFRGLLPYSFARVLIRRWGVSREPAGVAKGS